MTLNLALVITGDATGAKAAVEETKSAVTGLGTASEKATGQVDKIGASLGGVARDAQAAGGQLTRTGAAGGQAAAGLRSTETAARGALGAIGGLRGGLLLLAGTLAGGAIVGLLVGVFHAAVGAAADYAREVLDPGIRIKRELEAQAGLVDHIRDRYTAAGRAAEAYGLVSRQEELRQARDQLETLTAERDALNRGVANLLNAFGGQGETGANRLYLMQQQFGPLTQIVEKFIADTRAGHGDVLAFRDAVAGIANAAGSDAGVRQMAADLQSYSKNAVDAAVGTAKAEAAARMLDGTATAADRALLGLGNSMRETGNAALGAIPSIGEYERLLRSISSYSPKSIAANRLHDFNEEIAQAREAINDLPLLARGPARDALNAAANENRPYVNPVPPPRPAPRPSSGAISPSQGSGVTDYRNEIQSIQQRTAALKLEAETFGMSEVAAERYRIQHELIAAAVESGIPVTDALRASTGALADEYAAAAQQMATLKAQAASLEEIKGLFKDIFGGIVQDLRDGKSGVETLLGALGKIEDKLLDMALNNLANALFTSAGGGGGTGGGLLALLRSVLGFADGGAFGNGIVTSPTMFGYGGGKLGVMGEAGPEAVLPLKQSRGSFAIGAIANDNREIALPLARLASGSLGVRLPERAQAFAMGGTFGAVTLDNPATAPYRATAFAAGQVQAPGGVTNIYVETPNPRAFRDDRVAVLRGAQRLTAQMRRHG